MAFSPNLFLANAKLKDGFAKTNRFEVIIPIPPYVAKFIKPSFLDSFINNAANAVRDVSSFIKDPGKLIDNNTNDGSALTRYLALQCETASLPGKSLMTSDVDIYGPTFKVPYKTQLDGDMQFSFICTNEFYERKLFEKWIESINPQNTYNMRYQKDEKTRYSCDITIIQYDEFIKQIYSVKLIDAFPIAVAPMQLSWGDEGFHRLNVNFTYRKYDIIYKGSYDLAGAATALFGTAGARLVQAGQNKLFFK